MTQNLPLGAAPTPLHGAAMATLWPQFAEAVGSCATPGHKSALEARFGGVRNWAAGQSPEVNAAYQWATEELSRMATERMALLQNSMAVQAAFQTIPKPDFSGAGDGQ